MSHVRPSVAIGVASVTASLGGAVVLDGISLDVEPGEWVAIAGPNGAGKTTLLRVLAGVQPHTGSVSLGGLALDQMGARERALTVALVPQDPVIPVGMSVYDYVLLGRTPHRGRRLSVTPDDERIAVGVLERLELVELAGRRLGALSGGERQRVVIGRALAQDAAVLLLDEPTSSLDLGHQQEVLELVEALRRERALTVVMTMHDLTLAAQFSDRIAMLAHGRLVSVATPAEILVPALLEEVYGAHVLVLATPAGPVVVPTRSH